jgi:glycosyltransferase involved in cell wall biosynthesis
LNSREALEGCLSAINQLAVGEVILVDGGSKDGSIEVAKQFGVRILSDSGTGLGAARNLGSREASLDFVVHVGPDNVMTCEAISQMVELLEGGHDFVGCQTRLAGEDYLSKGTNFWRKTRFSVGPQSTVGTPSMSRKTMMVQFPYDQTRRFSDDSELCERLRIAGKSIYAGNAVVWEAGYVTLNAIVGRWRMYGKSDYEVFQHLRSQKESPLRLLKSLLHPLRYEFFTPLRAARFVELFYYGPFLALITAVRYASWFQEARKNARR